MRNFKFIKKHEMAVRVLQHSFFHLFLISAIFFKISTFYIKPNVIGRTNYLPPPTVIKNLALGFNSQVSDSFWLRAVQDFEHCDQPKNKQECTGKSWLFKVIDLTTDLDLKFREAFYYGGLALTIIISDYEGASQIFDKGVREFPNVWHLNYAAGYHALVEEKDKLKASKLFLAAAKNGGPTWLTTSAGRLAVEGGDKGAAKKILEDMIQSSDDPKFIDRLKKKINEN